MFESSGDAKSTDERRVDRGSALWRCVLPPKD